MRSLLELLPLFVLCACASAEPPAATSPTSPAETTPAGPPASADSPAGTAPAASGGTAPAPSKAGPPGAMCGGIVGFGCASGAYCLFAPEAQCGAADQSGTCAAIPEMCTKEYAPVCGCDDKTYGNACAAASAGVSARLKGKCSG